MFYIGNIPSNKVWVVASAAIEIAKHRVEWKKANSVEVTSLKRSSEWSSTRLYWSSTIYFWLNGVNMFTFPVNRCVVDNNRSSTFGYLQQPGPVVCGAAYQCGEACHAAYHDLLHIPISIDLNLWVYTFQEIICNIFGAGLSMFMHCYSLWWRQRRGTTV